MKIRQFIVLCLLIVGGFGVIYYQNDQLAKRHDYIEFMVKYIDKDVYDTSVAINWPIMKMIKELYNK